MIEEFVPDKSELKEQGAEGVYDEIQQDTMYAVASALKSAGVDTGVDVSADIARRRWTPWWRRNYGSGYVWLGNQKYQVSPIRSYEVSAFYYDLIGLAGAYNVDVHTSPAEFQVLRLTYRYAWEMFKWFRVVREKASLTYAGAMTVGNGLILDKLLPADFDKTDWLQTISSTGANDFYGTSSSAITIGTTKGLAIFAHTDEVVFEGEESPIDQVKVQKNGTAYVARGLNFRVADGVEDNRGVFTFVPNDTIYVQINATAAKNTKYHPVGVVLIPVDTAKQLNVNRIKA